MLYEKPGIKIMTFKHPETIKASKPDWGIFNEHFIDVFNSTIFSQPAGATAVILDSKPLILKNKHVVAYEDLEQIVFRKRFH